MFSNTEGFVSGWFLSRNRVLNVINISWESTDRIDFAFVIIFFCDDVVRISDCRSHNCEINTIGVCGFTFIMSNEFQINDTFIDVFTIS